MSGGVSEPAAPLRQRFIALPPLPEFADKPPTIWEVFSKLSRPTRLQLLGLTAATRRKNGANLGTWISRELALRWGRLELLRHRAERLLSPAAPEQQPTTDSAVRLNSKSGDKYIYRTIPEPTDRNPQQALLTASSNQNTYQQQRNHHQLAEASYADEDASARTPSPAAAWWAGHLR